MAPKKNKQREKLEQSQASSRAKMQQTLQAAGASGGFVGFASFATGNASAAASSASASASKGAHTSESHHDYGAVSTVYDGSDHEMALALKMLGKKGTVTKIKALNSFLLEILPPKKPLEIRGMLGHFVQLYTHEIRDQKDRKVRQLMNSVLLLLTTKLKPKAFAPHFRRLLPFWLMAMHDPSTEAAALARQAMEALFPGNREMQAEVIVAHLATVMDEFAGFFHHSPATFPGALLQDDEKEERYERCVTMSVLAIDGILNLFAETDHLTAMGDASDSATPSMASLLSSDKFGRLVSAASKNANFSRDSIRRATYITLKSLCQHALPLIRARELYFGKLVLGALSDKCPGNQHDLWDVVLLFLTVVPTVWDAEGTFAKFVKSAVLPRLFAQIRHGFYGAARASFPMLLPLLSTFPLSHMVDGKTGACPAFEGTIENAWKFYASTESRSYERDVVSAMFECLTAFLDVFLRNPLNETFAHDHFVASDESETHVHGYVNAFEKTMKNSLVTIFTSERVSERQVKVYATQWFTMLSRLTAKKTDNAVAQYFLGRLNQWQEHVLQSIVMTGTPAVETATRIHCFYGMILKEAGDQSKQNEILDSATVIGRQVYQYCLTRLQQQPKEATIGFLFALVNGFYSSIGLHRLLHTSEDSKNVDHDKTVESHYEAYVRPTVCAIGMASGAYSEAVTITVLRSVRHFVVHVSDKKSFLRALFQDLAVQYGDMNQAALIVKTCLQFPYTRAGTVGWLASGSFVAADNTAAETENTTELDALTALWQGKLLDEFVMISLKGRLDDHEGDSFGVLLRACLCGRGRNGNDGDDKCVNMLPVVTADIVVILSHFVTQQRQSASSGNSDAVVMRILPSLVDLFATLHNNLGTGVGLPNELEAAEEEVYSCLFHLAAISNFAVEARALWGTRACATIVHHWQPDRRHRFIVDSLASEVNQRIEISASTSTDGESGDTSSDVPFSAKVWSSYVRVYLELGNNAKDAGDMGNEGSDAQGKSRNWDSSTYMLLTSLSIMSLQFSGSRAQITVMYDRLLSGLAELCEDATSAQHIVTFLDEMFRLDAARACESLRRLIDIDVCHALTWHMLRPDGNGDSGHDEEVAKLASTKMTTFVPLEDLWLRHLYAALQDHVLVDNALVQCVIQGKSCDESDSCDNSHRRILFMNHNEVVKDDSSIAEKDATNLSWEQNAELTRLVVDVLASLASPNAIATVATQWIDAPQSILCFDETASALIPVRVTDEFVQRDYDKVQEHVQDHVLDRVLTACEERMRSWPESDRDASVESLRVWAACWRGRPHSWDQSSMSTNKPLHFNLAAHRDMPKLITSGMAVSSASTLKSWLAVIDYVSTLPSAWATIPAEDDAIDELAAIKKDWSGTVRALLLHALAGKQDLSEVAALRLHKQHFAVPSSAPVADEVGDDDVEHGSQEIENEDEDIAPVVAYSRNVVRGRRAVMVLLATLAKEENGEDLLQELATHHREALLSVVLLALAEGLEIKSRVVSAYLTRTTPTSSLAMIQLTLDADALLLAATRALPVVLATIYDTDRVKSLLLAAFGSTRALATCFNSEDSAAMNVHVRAVLYVLCTYTGVLHPSSAAASVGIDLNADDEDATEAALAKTLIPRGLRRALLASFSPPSTSSGTHTASRPVRRRQHKQQQPEMDEMVNRLLLWDLFLQLFPGSNATSLNESGSAPTMLSSALSGYALRHGLLSQFLSMTGSFLARETSGASSSALLSQGVLQDEPLFQVQDLDVSSGTAMVAGLRSADGRLDEALVVKLAARAFFRTVIRLPAMVRTWWNDECSRSLRSWAAKYFEEHITPYVLTSELEIIQKASETHSWDAEEMSVKGSKVSREITTTYVKDECALEMVIRVPPSYPLRSVEVECTRRIGISEDRWRRWVLQIIKVTSAQDGSLLDAVLLWKQNVDKEFEGVEPCPICYSILNPKTMGLPSLACKTCSNRYHNSCLYKWFNQSGKNKCPICQQPFTS